MWIAFELKSNISNVLNSYGIVRNRWCETQLRDNILGQKCFYTWAICFYVWNIAPALSDALPSYGFSIKTVLMRMLNCCWRITHEFYIHLNSVDNLHQNFATHCYFTVAHSSRPHNNRTKFFSFCSYLIHAQRTIYFRSNPIWIAKFLS